MDQCTRLNVKPAEIRSFVLENYDTYNVFEQTGVTEAEIKTMNKKQVCSFLIKSAPTLLELLLDKIVEEQTEALSKKESTTVVNAVADELFGDKVIYDKDQVPLRIVAPIISAKDNSGKKNEKLLAVSTLRNNKPKFNIPIFEETDETLLETICKTFGKLKYGGNKIINTCYHDSVLMLLYTVFEEFTEQNIFVKKSYKNAVCDGKDDQQDLVARNNVGKALDFYHNRLQNKESTQCPILKKQLAECKVRGFEDFSNNDMRDANEFLAYLFTVFEVEGSITYTKDIGRRRVDKVWDTKGATEKINHDASPLYIIHPDELKTDVTVSQLLDYTVYSKIEYGPIDENGYYEYNEKLKRSMYYDGEVLILGCNRIGGDGKFNYNKIIPENQVSLPGSGRKLRLVGIVIFDNKHYTSVLRCGNRWFHYDDLGPTITKIENSLEELLSWRNSIVCKQGVLYFYK